MHVAAALFVMSSSSARSRFFSPPMSVVWTLAACVGWWVARSWMVDCFADSRGWMKGKEHTDGYYCNAWRGDLFCSRGRPSSLAATETARVTAARVRSENPRTLRRGPGESSLASRVTSVPCPSRTLWSDPLLALSGVATSRPAPSRALPPVAMTAISIPAPPRCGPNGGRAGGPTGHRRHALSSNTVEKERKQKVKPALTQRGTDASGAPLVIYTYRESPPLTAWRRGRPHPPRSLHQRQGAGHGEAVTGTNHSQNPAHPPAKQWRLPPLSDPSPSPPLALASNRSLTWRGTVVAVGDSRRKSYANHTSLPPKPVPPSATAHASHR